MIPTTQELVTAVEQGKVAVSTAADIAGFSKEEQKEIVARGEKEIIEAAREIRSRKREAKRTEIKARLDEVAAREVIEPTGEYDVLVIDPPWPMGKIERDERPNQSELDYPTMNEEELLSITRLFGRRAREFPHPKAQTAQKNEG